MVCFQLPCYCSHSKSIRVELIPPNGLLMVDDLVGALWAGGYPASQVRKIIEKESREGG